MFSRPVPMLCRFSKFARKAAIAVAIVSVVRQHAKVPCAIGFGISGPEQAAKMAGISDGAIIGSAIIRILEKEGKNAPEKIGEFTKAVKTAIMA